MDFLGKGTQKRSTTQTASDGGRCKGDGKGDENMREWDSQWGRGTEWKSIEKEILIEKATYRFLIMKSIV